MKDSNLTGWEVFAKDLDEKPDRFFCVVCLNVWRGKAPKGKHKGSKAWNICPFCKTIYNAARIIHLSDDSRHVKVIASGVPVLVATAQLTQGDGLPSPILWQFWGDSINRLLLTEQGIEIAKVGDYWRLAGYAVTPQSTQAAPLAREQGATLSQGGNQNAPVGILATIQPKIEAPAVESVKTSAPPMF